MNSSPSLPDTRQIRDTNSVAFFILLSNDQIVDIHSERVKPGIETVWVPLSDITIPLPVGVDTVRLELPDGCVKIQAPNIHDPDRVFTVDGHAGPDASTWADC